ncbi:hypothetical protein [Streptomyces sp. NPDC052114]|uniref:hypothetical protein n=1 Tax=unclassified Streptomyces TaxID=2593676 RepID=UPI0034205511
MSPTPSYSKAEEGQIAKRALARTMELSIYLTAMSVARETGVDFGIVEAQAISDTLKDQNGVRRALAVRELERKFPPTPTPEQAAISAYAQAISEKMTRHDEELARFHAAGDKQ